MKPKTPTLTHILLKFTKVRNREKTEDNRKETYVQRTSKRLSEDF